MRRARRRSPRLQVDALVVGQVVWGSGRRGGRRSNPSSRQPPCAAPGRSARRPCPSPAARPAARRRRSGRRRCRSAPGRPPARPRSRDIGAESAPAGGQRMVSAAVSLTVMRILPAGRSRCAVTASSRASISSRAGRNDSTRRWPASVGATLRVVRVSRRTPSRSSSRRTVWLSADCDVPSRAAARVKLLASATARRAFSSESSARAIHELPSWVHADFRG